MHHNEDTFCDLCGVKLELKKRPLCVTFKSKKKGYERKFYFCNSNHLTRFAEAWIKLLDEIRPA